MLLRNDTLFVENLLMDDNSSPYKVVIVKEHNPFNSRIKTFITDKYFYRFNVNFNGATIFSRGFFDDLQECRDFAKRRFDKKVLER